MLPPTHPTNPCAVSRRQLLLQVDESKKVAKRMLIGLSSSMGALAVNSITWYNKFLLISLSSIITSIMRMHGANKRKVGEEIAEEGR